MVEFATFNTRYYSQRGSIVVPAWEYLRLLAEQFFSSL